ncbi:hypothetical protein ACHAXS_010323 [Conticribra weissflogii]
MASNTNSSGQDAEEAAELMATMKADHVPMKTWYNHPDHQGPLSDLKAKHGDFPSFWQDLVKWGGWKEVRRMYLRFTETGSFGSEDDGRKRSRADNDSQAASDRNNTTSAASAAAPRKRKSRWGRGRDDAPRPSTNAAPAPAPVNDPVMAALGLSALPATAPLAAPSVPAGLPSLLASNLTPDQQSELTSLQSRLRDANRILANLPAEAARVDSLPRDHPSRSPSPPPVYDAYGNRKNTRANRWKERYTEERLACLERIAELCPSMKPTLAGVTKRKRSRKIPIPVDEHPTYNFIGLIIGPRGKTQKDMEAKTGCKIAIRGKGSVKEGAKGRLTKNGTAQLAEGEDEPLHVVITGDDPAAIDAAAEMITQMLVVIDDEKNVHKQNQLRELALLNGTLKEEEWCHLCGEKGHRNFECPKKFALNNRNVLKVKCAICGDTSHPTRDCTMRGKAGLGVETVGGEQSEVEKEKQLDSDYSAFMAELEGKSASAAGESGVAGATAVPDMGSVLTIIQPARVVKVGESTEDTTSSASAAPAVDPNTGVTTISAVTTISSTVIKPAAAPVTDAASGITTISSTATPAASGVVSTPAAAPGVTTLSSTSLPPAPTALPPLPPGVPPPLPPGHPPASSATIDGGVAASAPVGTATDATAGESNGNITGSTAPLPPPPPPSAAPGVAPAYPGYGQQYVGQHGQWSGYYQQQQPPPPGGYPQHQGYGTYQQNPQSQWGGYNAGAYGQAQYPLQGASNGATDETAGWDPNTYYGAAANGAGGFNWWESSS